MFTSVIFSFVMMRAAMDQKNRNRATDGYAPINRLHPAGSRSVTQLDFGVKCLVCIVANFVFCNVSESR